MFRDVYIAYISMFYCLIVGLLVETSLLKTNYKMHTFHTELLQVTAHTWRVCQWRLLDNTLWTCHRCVLIFMLEGS